uniref:Uncharacterized protein n=1 Tax=Rhizophora mucronata TaxID=61149 RepID=A0A2P2P1K6_RHIMU
MVIMVLPMINFFPQYFTNSISFLCCSCTYNGVCTITYI